MVEFARARCVMNARLSLLYYKIVRVFLKIMKFEAKDGVKSFVDRELAVPRIGWDSGGTRWDTVLRRTA